MIIGVLHKTGDGFAGRLQTLALRADICIVPAQPSGNANAPDWHLLLGGSEDGAEVGAGWDRTGERAGAFIAVQIDDPALPVPIRANLLRSAQNGDEYHLLWSRALPQGRG